MNLEAEEKAYQEMTHAAKIVADKIREFPHLLDQLCREVEIALITIALKRSNGNCTKAARLLGVNRTTLVEKRRRYRLPIKVLNEKV